MKITSVRNSLYSLCCLISFMTVHLSALDRPSTEYSTGGRGPDQLVAVRNQYIDAIDGFFTKKKTENYYCFTVEGAPLSQLTPTTLHEWKGAFLYGKACAYYMRCNIFGLDLRGNRITRDSRDYFARLPASKLQSSASWIRGGVPDGGVWVALPEITHAATAAAALDALIIPDVQCHVTIHGHLSDALKMIRRKTSVELGEWANILAREGYPFFRNWVLAQLGMTSPTKEVFLDLYDERLLIVPLIQRMIEIGNITAAVTAIAHLPKEALREMCHVSKWSRYADSCAEKTMKTALVAKNADFESGPLPGISLYSVVMASGNAELQHAFFQQAVAKGLDDVVYVLLNPGTNCPTRTHLLDCAGGGTWLHTFARTVTPDSVDFQELVFRHCVEKLGISRFVPDHDGRDPVSYLPEAVQKRMREALFGMDGVAVAPAGWAESPTALESLSEARAFEPVAEHREELIPYFLGAAHALSPAEMASLVRVTRGFSLRTLQAYCGAVRNAAAGTGIMFKHFKGLFETFVGRAVADLTRAPGYEVTLAQWGEDSEVRELPGMTKAAYEELFRIRDEVRNLRLDSDPTSSIPGTCFSGMYGMGKTEFAELIARMSQAIQYKIEDIEALPEVLRQAAEHTSPVIVLLDEMDQFSSVRLRMFLQPGDPKQRCVYVLGTTNKPDAIDRGIVGLHGARLTAHSVPFPSKAQRAQIIYHYVLGVMAEEDRDIPEKRSEARHLASVIAADMEGLSGRDIERVVKSVASATLASLRAAVVAHRQKIDAALAGPVNGPDAISADERLARSAGEFVLPTVQRRLSPEHPDVIEAFEQECDWVLPAIQQRLMRTFQASAHADVACVAAAIARDPRRRRYSFDAAEVEGELLMLGDDAADFGPATYAEAAGAAAAAAGGAATRGFRAHLRQPGLLVLACGYDIDAALRASIARRGESVAYASLDISTVTTPKELEQFWDTLSHRVEQEYVPGVLHIHGIGRQLEKQGAYSPVMSALHARLKVHFGPDAAPRLFVVATVCDAEVAPTIQSSWFSRGVINTTQPLAPEEHAACVARCAERAGLDSLTDSAHFLLERLPPHRIREVFECAAELRGKCLRQACGVVCVEPLRGQADGRFSIDPTWVKLPESDTAAAAGAAAPVAAGYVAPSIAQERDALTRFYTKVFENNEPIEAVLLVGTSQIGKTHMLRQFGREIGATVCVVEASDLAAQKELQGLLSLDFTATPRPMVIIRHVDACPDAAALSLAHCIARLTERGVLCVGTAAPSPTSAWALTRMPSSINHHIALQFKHVRECGQMTPEEFHQMLTIAFKKECAEQSDVELLQVLDGLVRDNMGVVTMLAAKLKGKNFAEMRAFFNNLASETRFKGEGITSTYIVRKLR